MGKTVWPSSVPSYLSFLPSIPFHPSARVAPKATAAIRAADGHKTRMGDSPSVRSSVRPSVLPPKPNGSAPLHSTPLRQDWSEISGPFFPSLPSSDLSLLQRRTVMVMGGPGCWHDVMGVAPAHVGSHLTGRFGFRWNCIKSEKNDSRKTGKKRIEFFSRVESSTTTASRHP